MGYLDKIRMASIYGNRPRNIGNKYELYNKFKSDLPREQGNLGQIARQVAAPISTMDSVHSKLGLDKRPYMNTVYQPPAGEITPLHEKQFELQEQDIQAKNDLAGATLGVRQQDADTRSRRADIQAFQAANPNLKIIEQRGGNIVGIDPRTGEVKATLGSSGLLSDEDKIEQGSAADIARIKAGGIEDRDTQLERFAQRLQEIMAGGEQDRLTQGEKPLPPNQERAGFLSRVEQLLNTKPEWRQYIQFDGDNVQVREPAKGGTGISDYFGNRPDAETYKDIQEALYGSATTPGLDVAPPPERPPNIPPPGAGTIPMMLPNNGGIKYFPPSAVPEAVRRGATLVTDPRER